MFSHDHATRAIHTIYWSQNAYWCTLLIAVVSLIYLPPGPVRTGVVLTPVLTGLYGLSLVYWLYRDSDEYIQLRILKCAAVTAAVVIFGTLGYFLLELCGFPRLSAIAINLISSTVFNLQLMYVLIASR
jgi:TctA family transporter